MTRNSLKTYIKNREIVIPNGDNSEFLLDDFNFEKLVIEENAHADVLISGFDKDLNIDILLKENAYLNIKGVIESNTKNVKINADLHENSSFSASFLDFSNGKVIEKGDIKCLGNNSSAVVRIASLTSVNDDKHIAFSINHIALNTNGLVDNYGVCKDTSKLEFAGVNHIARGAKKTITRQASKIMLIDKSSDGIAKPTLKIDESDVSASHGAAIGQINEDQLFYLQTRGINETDARKLIVLGYFTPILKMFENEDNFETISNLLENKL